uniref:Uncharacterized protein n=1 Tax=Arundo donax TaxID=35708 RepID=A0A0A9GCW9_ARUDO
MVVRGGRLALDRRRRPFHRRRLPHRLHGDDITSGRAEPQLCVDHLHGQSPKKYWRCRR